MPTARELIEQADALMRRNRSQPEPQADTTAASSSPTPDIGDDSTLELPPPPAWEALANVPAADLREPADEVPVLTEAVDGDTEIHEEGDDVPLLTEAVEDALAPARFEPVVEGQSAESIVDDRDEVALLGRAPASAIAVPPTVEHDDEASIRAEGGEADDREVLVRRLPREDEAPSHEPIRDEDPDAIDRALGLHRPVPATATASTDGVRVTDVGGVGPSTPPDDARWTALAEEIRMQVLQRIDIFTDTGLRAQLGERLKPVVDRASADLVATINQHVGDLLRAYVAEAIEREIERWRSESGSR